jgi:uncharacterized membrane protein YoaK (UPF0700 family)
VPRTAYVFTGTSQELLVPINYSRRLSGPTRHPIANQHLGFILAFVAGAINAGGFLAVHQYTSHMTGIVSSMADNLSLGEYTLTLAGLGAVVSFLAGAACCAFIVNYSRRLKLHSEFAIPLLLESGLLLLFGLLGIRLAHINGFFVPVTVLLLSFLMGLQNALITKISGYEIRTTHITGIVTDIGIELGKLAYWNASSDLGVAPVVANRGRLKVMSMLAVLFFIGGVTGAFGFKYFGYLATIPLSVVLVSVAIGPLIDDLTLMAGVFSKKK